MVADFRFNNLKFATTLHVVAAIQGSIAYNMTPVLTHALHIRYVAIRYDITTVHNFYDFAVHHSP